MTSLPQAIELPSEVVKLKAAELHALAEVPAAAELFANLGNANTRRSYQNDLQEFMRFVGISAEAELGSTAQRRLTLYRYH